MTGEFVLRQLDDTRRLAERVAGALACPMTLALNGTLGAGKTQFARYLVAALGGEATEVTSPTYVLLQRYRGRCWIYHFDFYRLEHEAQVWDLGIDELYEQPCVVVIEWADKFPGCLPDDWLELRFRHSEGGERRVVVAAHGEGARRLRDGVLP